MGWASGSAILADIVVSVQKTALGPLERYYLYSELIDTFSDNDCDTLDEVLGIDPSFDEAYKDYFE